MNLPEPHHTILLQTALQNLGFLSDNPDGDWGPHSQVAFDAYVAKNKPVSGGTELPGIRYNVFASSFADPKDVAAFKACKATGKTDQECFKVGDNGIGCWGDDCTSSVPMCALPPERMISRWGSKAAAKRQLVRVEGNGRSVICVLGDVMPSLANITNGCGIDLSPAAVKALGLTPPIRIPAVWSWV